MSKGVEMESREFETDVDTEAFGVPKTSLTEPINLTPLFGPTFDINKMQIKGIDKETNEYRLLPQSIQQGTLDNMNQNYATAYKQYVTFNTFNPEQKVEMLNSDDKNSPINVLQRLKVFINKKYLGTTNPKDILFSDKDNSELKLESNEYNLVLEKINNLIIKWQELQGKTRIIDEENKGTELKTISRTMVPRRITPEGGRTRRRQKKQKKNKKTQKRHKKRTNKRKQKRHKKTMKR